MFYKPKMNKGKGERSRMVIDIQKLQTECARQCWSIRDLLKKARVSACTWHRIKKGLKVQPKVAGKLAFALQVDVVKILQE